MLYFIIFLRPLYLEKPIIEDIEEKSEQLLTGLKVAHYFKVSCFVTTLNSLFPKFSIKCFQQKLILITAINYL